MKVKITIVQEDPTTSINEYKKILTEYGMSLAEIYDYYQTLYEVFSEETMRNKNIKLSVTTELMD